MSDSWLVLVPSDPGFVPSPASVVAARDRLVAMLGRSDQIRATTHDHIELFDCGENLRSISCPACGAEISTEWWQDQMDADYGDEGFCLAKYPTLCCAVPLTLNELIYDRPQRFGRFALEARNPSPGVLNDAQVAELSAVVGCALRVVVRLL